MMGRKRREQERGRERYNEDYRERDGGRERERKGENPLISGSIVRWHVRRPV
jgi:hypothetical protein